MNETADWSFFSPTTQQGVGLLRIAREVSLADRLGQLIAPLTGSGVSYSVDDAAARVAADLVDPFEALRTPTTQERTEELLVELATTATAAQIVARLVDGQESTVLRARLVTLVPSLKGRYREPDLLFALETLADHPDSEIRYVVADALGEFPTEKARQLLRRLANDEVASIREVAEESLGVPG